jgi:hypothetical protein
LGNVKVNSVTLNGNQLSAEQYTVENFMLTINADLLTEDSNVIVINGEKTVNVTLV